MKPYEIKDTMRIMRKLSGSESIKIGIDLTESSLRILADSIRENGKITDKELNDKINQIIWEIKPWIMRESLKK